MKKIYFMICFVAWAGINYNATAQNKEEQKKAIQNKNAAGKEAPAKNADAKAGTQDGSGGAMTQEQMKAWMEYSTPGPMQQLLAKYNGEWTEEVTMWMDPAAAPTKSIASCSTQMIMGDRYQESKSRGDFNGMPFEGTSIVGYDNGKKVFVSTWIDNMGTGIMYMEGKYDEKTKTVNFTGNMYDPM